VGVDYEKLVERTNLKSVEDMFAALGAGDIRLAHLVNQAQQLVEPDRDAQLELIPRRGPTQVARPGGRSDIQIQGVGNLLTQIDRKSTRLNSSHVKISYAVFCLKKKTTALTC